MKMLLLLVGCVATVLAQTNHINISNSHVVINNYYIGSMTKTTNNVIENPPRSTNRTVLPNEWVERLRWEHLLMERRSAKNAAYLGRFERSKR